VKVGILVELNKKYEPILLKEIIMYQTPTQPPPTTSPQTPKSPVDQPTPTPLPIVPKPSPIKKLFLISILSLILIAAIVLIYSLYLQLIASRRLSQVSQPIDSSSQKMNTSVPWVTTSSTGGNYSNDQLGISFNYPTEWYVTQWFKQTDSELGLKIDLDPQEHVDREPSQIPPILISLNTCFSSETKRVSPCQSDLAHQIAQDLERFNFDATSSAKISNQHVIGTIIEGFSVGDGSSREFYRKTAYILWKDEYYFTISIWNKDYQKIFDQILSTFKFIDSNTSAVDTSGWEKYLSTNYSFIHPAELKSDTDAAGTGVDSIRFRYMGPKQIATGRTQTDLFDGYAFIVTKIASTKDSTTLIEAEKAHTNSQENCPSEDGAVETINTSTVSSQPAYSYSVTNCFADYTSTFVSNNDAIYNIIVTYTGDEVDYPTYKNITHQILSSFKFTN